MNNKLSNSTAKPISAYSLNRKISLELALNHIPKESKILDLGCADGYISEFFKDRGYGIIGTDIDSKSLNAAKKRGIKTISADFNKRLPFKDYSFDAVIILEVIEHLYNIEGFVSEIKRILKPGGWLILSTPNSALLTMRLSYLLGKTSTEIQNPGHLRFFNLKSLKQKLKDFEIVEVKGLTHFPLLSRISNMFIFKTPFAKSLFSLYFYFACRKPIA
jgi:methionine biosynthesis protein MetW